MIARALLDLFCSMLLSISWRRLVNLHCRDTFMLCFLHFPGCHSFFFSLWIHLDISPQKTNELKVDNKNSIYSLIAAFASCHFNLFMAELGLKVNSIEFSDHVNRLEM